MAPWDAFEVGSASLKGLWPMAELPLRPAAMVAFAAIGDLLLFLMRSRSTLRAILFGAKGGIVSCLLWSRRMF